MPQAQAAFAHLKEGPNPMTITPAIRSKPVASLCGGQVASEHWLIAYTAYRNDSTRAHVAMRIVN